MPSSTNCSIVVNGAYEGVVRLRITAAEYALEVTNADSDIDRKTILEGTSFGNTIGNKRYNY